MSAEANAGGVTLTQVYGELSELRGGVSARLEILEAGQTGLRSEVQAGLLEIRHKLDEDHDGDAELRARVAQVEARQTIVYRILGAVALLAASGLAGVLLNLLGWVR